MNTVILKEKPLVVSVRRFVRSVLPAIPMMLFTVAAHAQTVSGGIDPQSGLTQILGYFLTLVGLGFIGVSAYKGIVGYMRSESIGLTVVGLIVGLCISYGGYYILQRYGVSA